MNTLFFIYMAVAGVVVIVLSLIVVLVAKKTVKQISEFMVDAMFGLAIYPAALTTTWPSVKMTVARGEFGYVPIFDGVPPSGAKIGQLNNGDTVTVYDTAKMPSESIPDVLYHGYRRLYGRDVWIEESHLEPIEAPEPPPAPEPTPAGAVGVKKIWIEFDQ